MAILDTFYILFESDTSKLDESVDKSRLSVDEILESMKKTESGSDSMTSSIASSIDGINQSLSGTSKEIDAVGNTMKGANLKPPVDEFDKAIKEATASIVDLKNKLSEAGDKSESLGKKGTSAGKSMYQQWKKTLWVIGSFVAVAKAIESGLSKAFEVDELDRFSSKIGSSIEDVDAFSRVLEGIGGSSEEAQSGLQAVSDKAKGTGDAMAHMLKLSDKVKGMSFGSAAKKLKDFGITDNKTIELMIQGRREIENLMRRQKENGVATKAMAEQARALRKSYAELKSSFSGVSESIFTTLAPALIKVIGWMKDLVEFSRRHQGVIVGFFTAMATVITLYYLPAILKATVATTGLIARMAIAAAPFLLLAGLLALIAEELIATANSEDTLAKKIMEDFPIIGTFFDNVAERIGIFIDSLKWAYGEIKQWVNDNLGSFTEFKDDVFKVVDWVVEKFVEFGKGLGILAAQIKLEFIDPSIDAFNSLKTTVKGIFDGIWNIVVEVWNKIVGIVNKIKGIGGKVAGWFGFDVGDGEELIIEAKRQIEIAENHPLNSTSAQQISNMRQQTNETTVKIDNLNVQTQATDAKGMADAAEEALTKQLSNLASESATGKKYD